MISYIRNNTFSLAVLERSNTLTATCILGTGLRLKHTDRAHIPILLVRLTLGNGKLTSKMVMALKNGPMEANTRGSTPMESSMEMALINGRMAVFMLGTGSRASWRGKAGINGSMAECI